MWELVRYIDKSGSSYNRRNSTTGEIQDVEMTDELAKRLSKLEEEQEALAEWKGQRAMDDDMHERIRIPPDEWA